MEKNIRKFLRNSFVFVITVCIIVFIVLVLIMGDKTVQTIDEISEIYMSEMNTQLQQKFSTIVGLRLNQIEGIVKRTPPEYSEYGDSLKEELKLSAEVREFSFLALCAENGDLETIYGGKVDVPNDKLLESLKTDGDVVVIGTNSQGEKMLVLGMEAGYPMAGGKQSVAIVAGVPMDYLKEALFLDSDDTLIYSHIIDGDGNREDPYHDRDYRGII